ncbi:helix-turn-helix domain-containing protein [Streptomyces thermodiastaticus]
MNRTDQPAEQQRDARALAEHVLAEVIRHEREQAATRAAAGNHTPYDQLAAALDLADLRALRVAGEAAAAATPRAIKAARARGMKPPQIAAELGLTPSRVYQVLRELDAADGDQ